MVALSDNSRFSVIELNQDHQHGECRVLGQGSAGGESRMMDCASWIPSVYTNQHNIAKCTLYIVQFVVCGIQSARKVLACVAEN